MWYIFVYIFHLERNSLEHHDPERTHMKLSTIYAAWLNIFQLSPDLF